MCDLPELPPKIPFFNVSNAQNVEQRVRGLQEFLNHSAQKKLKLVYLAKPNIQFLKPFTSLPPLTGGFLWKRKKSHYFAPERWTTPGLVQS
ncbi:sorting nexin-10 [Rhinophrynus dorsalis]